jgi:hypothetical protein
LVHRHVRVPQPSLLGINDLVSPAQVWIGGYWFTVVGVLNPVPGPVELDTPMDAMAFIGFPIAGQYFGFDGHPHSALVRTDPRLALYGGIGAAFAIGAIAGLYPASRAARLSPTEALRTA